MFDIWAVYKGIKSKFTQKDLLLSASFLIGYFFTRLINLSKFPIFSDEAIYIHWAKVAWHDAAWRFISLTDGKQPLQTWGTIPFLKLFQSDALLAGRMFSVFTGLFALVGVFCLVYYLFGKRAAFIGAFLYIITPYFLFYDRMALVDSGVNGFFVWIILLSLILIDKVRLDVALILGLLSGVGLLAKSSVRLFLLLGYGALILTLKSKRKVVNFSILFAVSVIIALTIYNVQRLSPFFQFVSQKNNTFIMTTGELLQTPFKFFLSNIMSIPYFVFSEMSYIVALLGIIGLYLLFKNKNKHAIYFTILLVIPLIIISFISKILFPRYIIFFGSTLLILASYALSQIKNKKNLLISMSLILISVAYFNYALLFDHTKIPFPGVDRGQYLEGWPAGWGARDIVEYARGHSTGKRITFLAEGDFGMAGDVLDTFILPSDNIGIIGKWPLDERHLFENQKLLEKEDVYVVFGHRSEFPQHWPLELIKKYEKPGNKSALYFFKLTP